MSIMRGEEAEEETAIMEIERLEEELKEGEEEEEE